MKEIAQQALSRGLVLTKDQELIFKELAIRGPSKARRLAIVKKMGGGVFTEVVKLIKKFRQILNGKGHQVGVAVFGKTLNERYWLNQARDAGYMVLNGISHAEFYR